MDVLLLLQAKNRCLSRFLSVSSDFLERAKTGDLSDLDKLQARRDAILKTLNLFDRKLFDELSALPETFITAEMRASMREALQISDETLAKIRTIDSEILELIQQEAGKVQREIHLSRKGKDTISKFKSHWVKESGTEVDSQL